jgi:hypothetical protein|tara:strand:+ start:365 stop:904 length:540 start_codon:yes stop_codon:yes gene_type:complete
LTGEHLGRGLRKSVYLKELILIGNNLGSVGTLSIAKGLLENISLQTLDLSSNLICLDNRAHSGSNHYGLELRAVNKLCEVIQTVQSLTSLSLRNNHLGTSGVLLAKAMSSNQTMIVLDVSDNDGIENKTVRSIQKKLDENIRFTKKYTSKIGKTATNDMIALGKYSSGKSVHRVMEHCS